MWRLPLALSCLSAFSWAADDTPLNRKRLDELQHPELITFSLEVGLQQAKASVPEAAFVKIKAEFERRMKAGLAERIATQLNSQLLRSLTNEELAAYHRHATKPEARSVVQKSPLILGDIMPVLNDELMVCVGEKSSRTTFEIEQPWDIVPAKRRAILRELTPLLAEAMGDQNPVKLKAGMLAEIEAEAKARKLSPAAVAEVRRRFDSMRMERLLGAIEEANARRLSTEEAQARLEALKDPVYRSAEAKFAQMLTSILQHSMK
jgi:hypothetical protein